MFSVKEIRVGTKLFWPGTMGVGEVTDMVLEWSPFENRWKVLIEVKGFVRDQRAEFRYTMDELANEIDEGTAVIGGKESE